MIWCLWRIKHIPVTKLTIPVTTIYSKEHVLNDIHTYCRAIGARIGARTARAIHARTARAIHVRAARAARTLKLYRHV